MPNIHNYLLDLELKSIERVYKCITVLVNEWSARAVDEGEIS